MAQAHPIRKYIREILTISFWLHAVCVYQLIPYLSKPIPAAWYASAYNTALITFILYYSYFSDSGWLSVTWDLLYVYVWPFLFAWKILWNGCKGAYHFFKTQTILPRVGLIVATPAQAPPQPQEGTSLGKSLQDLGAHLKQVRTERRWTKLQRTLRPLTQFALLWSILILSLRSKPLIVIASLVTLVGAFRAVYGLWNLLSGTSDWLDKLRSGLATQLSSRIRQVREWEEAAGPEVITADVNSLKIFESIFTFIAENRTFLSKCTMGVAALVTVPFYVYVSVLFAAVYVGIARVGGIGFPWTTSITCSLYIPFAFTDLPHSLIIRLIAGLQAIAVTVMGWNIFFRQLSSKFNSVAGVATEFRENFQEETYRRKLAIVASLTSRASTVADQKKPPTSVVGTNEEVQLDGTNPS
jgi:hypothetical protein